MTELIVGIGFMCFALTAFSFYVTRLALNCYYDWQLNKRMKRL